MESLLKHVSVPAEARVTVRQEGEGRVMKLPFPPGTPVSTILRDYVDVQGPLRKKQIKDLAAAVEDSATKESLLSLQADKSSFKSEVEDKQVALLDLLEKFSIKLSVKHLKLCL